MSEKLKEWKGVSLAGIDFTYPHKTQCPKCASEGWDRSGDNLHVYGLDDDGRSLGCHCFSCPFTVPSEEFLAKVGSNSVTSVCFSGNFDKKGESMISKRDEEKLKEKSLTPEQLAEICERTSDSLTTKYRGLDAEVCKRLGVRWKYDDSGKVLEMWFPCHIYENGELKIVGYKIRKQNKVFSSKGYVGKLCLMGNQTNYVAETLVVVAGECFTDETEVMTERGFVNVSNVSVDDLVLQVDNSMQGSFVKPVALIRKEFSGELIGYETLTTHTLTTPKHNLVFKTPKGRVFKQQAQDKVSCGWLIPKTTTVDGSGIKLTNDEIKLVIAVCADGSLRNRVVGNNAVHLAFTKERKINRMKSILENLQISYSSYINSYSNGKTYTTFNFILPDYIVDKLLPKSWLVEATLQQRLFILEELRYWDGHYQQKKLSMEFTSKYISECEFVQELAHTAGLYASVRHRTNEFGEWYRCCVSYSYKNATTQSVAKYTKPYSGMVYCVTVPSGMILTRHKGKVTVSGNCDLVTAVKALQNKVNGSGKYKSISCNIVTPLLGEPHIADDLKANYEWVNKHKKIVICTDDDKAGHEALENIKKVLPSEKTFVVSLRHKDLNEYIDPRYNGGDSIADGNIKITQDVYWDSKPLEDYGVIGSDQLRQKARDRLTQDKIPFPKFLSGLAKHFTDGSMWTGEWVNLIAPTSVGKSSVTDAWMIDWSLNSPYRQAVMSYEAGAEDYGVKVSSLATGKAIFKIEGKENRIKFIDDNADIIDKLLITEDGLPRFDFIESLPTSVEKLKKQIMYLIKIRNIRVLWIDPILDLLAIAKGSKADYDDIILFFENVRTSHHVTIMSILHTRKSLSSGGNGSDGADVSEEDAYGGRELISKGTINITASRNKNAEDWIERNTTKLTIRKSRTDQVTGVHALLFYRAKANKLYPFEYAEEHDFWKHELSMKVEDIIIDDDVGFDLAIIGDEELGDDGDGEQIFEELSNSTVTLVDIPDW